MFFCTCEGDVGGHWHCERGHAAGRTEGEVDQKIDSHRDQHAAYPNHSLKSAKPFSKVSVQWIHRRLTLENCYTVNSQNCTRTLTFPEILPSAAMHGRLAVCVELSDPAMTSFFISRPTPKKKKHMSPSLILPQTLKIQCPSTFTI